ncbi:MAG: hypothetical protein AAFQ41_06970 [Cyanobacteria bacterium J06623_7]
MNKIVLLVLVGTLAFLTEGCSIFSNFADSQKELEKNAVKPIPARQNQAQAETQKTESEIFADLEEEEVEPLPVIAGLIPATNPDARVRSSVRGRNDPFSVVPLNPRIQIEAEEPRESVARNRVNSNRVNNNRVTNRIENNRNSSNNSRRPDFSDESADVFEPTLAQDVVISGLFEAGGRTRIIVQAPEESSSRYVEVGQYLSNGQILVKRIDKDHFPGPMIILEQSGVEVAKTIGGNTEGDRVSTLRTAPSENWSTAISLR